MKEQIILLGGGGHCKSCIDVIEEEGKYTIAGILDMPENVGQKISGYPFIGIDDDLDKLVSQYNNFFITVGHIQSPAIRIKLFERLSDLKVNLPVIQSPYAVVSRHAQIGRGSIIMHQAVVNTEARIGENCIINTGALVEHESKVGSNCHISTYAILNGQCKVGSECFIGSRTVLANNTEVVNSTLVAAGSVVLRSLEKAGTYIGNPLRKIR
ncbi:MAG: acetyltransferase [Bacteroidetes bacterium]|nr:acetyltransferase [Bacteroidota bacterium]MBT4398287.1 acetyltransferase [Bacteroidota bacterium]MBT4408888.1 acetyltransferase [Bacteroidota bacterium]MBT5428255.1 acetyltransferase [Bacteroidota bacterium]MBT7462449.1 acetyltransferase [Bacteroidota bacterium]